MDSSVGVCLPIVMLEVFCYLFPGHFKQFIQMVFKLTYAKEKQKSYFFLENIPFGKNGDVMMFHHISMFMLIALPVNLFSLNTAAKNFRLFTGRLLRNAIPADPGGGVVFFVDPQGAGSS